MILSFRAKFTAWAAVADPSLLAMRASSPKQWRLDGYMVYEKKSDMGVGALCFGMSLAQVHEILGAPRFSRIDPGHLREMYGGNPALTFTGTDNDLKLVEIGFVKQADEVTFRARTCFPASAGRS